LENARRSLGLTNGDPVPWRIQKHSPGIDERETLFLEAGKAFLSHDEYTSVFLGEYVVAIASLNERAL
jgi:hypothetical protein